MLNISKTRRFRGSCPIGSVYRKVPVARQLMSYSWRYSLQSRRIRKLLGPGSSIRDDPLSTQHERIRITTAWEDWRSCLRQYLKQCFSLKWKTKCKYEYETDDFYFLGVVSGTGCYTRVLYTDIYWQTYYDENGHSSSSDSIPRCIRNRSEIRPQNNYAGLNAVLVLNNL